MAGVKGRSGRKPAAVDVEQRLRVIQKCWDLLEQNIDNPDLDLKFRLDLAAKHTVKAIPTEVTGDINANIVAMGTIVYNGHEAKFDIGSPDNPPEDTQSPS